MLLQQRKSRLVMGGMLLLPVLLLWAIVGYQPQAPLRLTFLYSTNGVAGKTAVFELVNDLDESVACPTGHYQVAARKDIEPQRGDWGAQIPQHANFAAHSTNIVELWSPTNSGPYKLVMYCLPASKQKPQFYKSVGFRARNMLSRWFQPSFVTAFRRSGFIFVVSQPFQQKPSSN
jgi:hypothetical protein